MSTVGQDVKKVWPRRPPEVSTVFFLSGKLLCSAPSCSSIPWQLNHLDDKDCLAEDSRSTCKNRRFLYSQHKGKNGTIFWWIDVIWLHVTSDSAEHSLEDLKMT
ncbi:hypothetical protein D5086_027509 [Populus alba]|uniref:Uncharacterized protein n=1 Tax=Populus alba TaxID=43335 RepID=A0ACC4AVN6_POPAL